MAETDIQNIPEATIISTEDSTALAPVTDKAIHVPDLETATPQIDMNTLFGPNATLRDVVDAVDLARKGGLRLSYDQLLDSFLKDHGNWSPKKSFVLWEAAALAGRQAELHQYPEIQNGAASTLKYLEEKQTQLFEKLRSAQK